MSYVPTALGMHRRNTILAMALVSGLSVLWLGLNAGGAAAAAEREDPQALAIHQLRGQVADLAKQVAALQSEVALHSENEKILVPVIGQHGKAMDKLAGLHVACLVFGLKDGKVMAQACGK